MGYCPNPTPEMGEYSVEVRMESFYLRGEDNFDEDKDDYVQKRHGIHLYKRGNCGQGAIEILTEDIPKIRAALDQVERIEAGNPNGE